MQSQQKKEENEASINNKPNDEPEQDY